MSNLTSYRDPLAGRWLLFCCTVKFDLNNPGEANFWFVCYWNDLRENPFLQLGENCNICIWRKHEERELKVGNDHVAKYILFAKDWKLCETDVNMNMSYDNLFCSEILK